MMEPVEAVFGIEEPVLDEHNDEPLYGGYDFVFVDELSPGQTCSICLVAMRNPVQTVCGHRFCEDCLVGTFREGRGHACPQDRLYIPEEGGFFRDVAWERDILSLRVKCKMNERGCDWTGQLRHYESHFLECQFEDVVCDDCEDKMQRRFLDKHSTSECRERIVQCAYCNGEFAFWCLELHEDEDCTRFPLECPQQCGVQDIPREEVESHVEDECLMTLVVCPYKGAGCTYQDKRVNLKAHVEEYSEYHLSKTWSELQNTKQELLDVTCEMKKIEEVKNRVETLQSEKDDMEMSLQRNKEEISDLKLSEKKLEVENMSLSKEVNELGRQLAEVKTNAATENRSLRELLQSMQKKLEVIERKEAVKIMDQEIIMTDVSVPNSSTVHENLVRNNDSSVPTRDQCAVSESWYHDPVHGMVVNDRSDWPLIKSGNCTREKATANAYGQRCVPNKRRSSRVAVDRKLC